MIDLVFSHDCIILDACCIINLYASKRIEEILITIPRSVSVAAYVKNEEILKTFDISSDSTEDVDLQSLIDQGILILVDLDLETEAETWVNLASVLDDGEAVTGAIAFHRNWAIATDDRAAIKLFEREAPHLQIITTPELIKYWVDTTEPSPEVINQCLQNILFGASYHPAKKHHLYNWWQTYFTGDS
jgi:predicted nucleic acid-binding protein